MRTLLFVAFALLALPAFGQGWDAYANARFGYSVAVPPGFRGMGESDNGDGQEFSMRGKHARLLVWGGNLLENFESEAGEAIGYTEDAGWVLEDQSLTPRWATFSASQGSNRLYQRMVLLCDGTSYAAMRAEYPSSESAQLKQAIEDMGSSLTGTDC